jgi:hypothetical protein
VCIHRGEWSYVFEYLRLYCISKKKIPQISYKGFPGLLAYVSTVVCLIIHNSNNKILFRTEFLAAFHFAGSGMELMEDRWQGDVSSGLILA